ncbi:hypothetical protein JCM10207_001608 [Rhodosporidiobolus poonsookiae]
MFKRPHSAKTSAPVRTSDLRQLRSRILAAFPALNDDTALAKALLPDNTLAAKATTHLDEPCTLFAAPNGDPRWFRAGKGADGPLVPTCYALDLVPSLLPALETAPAVLPALVTGSALFLSGVSARSLEALPDDAKEGDLVGVVVAGQRGTVVAVGTLGADKRTLVELHNDDGGTGKGKAVVTLHARGDFLWQSGSQTQSSPLPLATSSSSSPPAASVSASASASAEDLSTALSSTSLSAAPPPSSEPSADAPAAAAPVDLSPAQVDQILLSALLLAIRTSLSLPSSAALFPMSASTLYSSWVLPFRPSPSSPSAAPGADKADLKRSSWKKLDRFVKEVGEGKGGKGKGKGRGYVTAKEVRGEWVVTGVNAAHPDVESQRSYRTLSQDASSTTSASTGAASPAGPPSSSATAAASASSFSSSAAAADKPGVQVTTYFKPSSAGVVELLSHIPHERPPNALYTHTALAALLRAFSTHFSLAHPRSPKLLLLSPSALPPSSPPSLEQESAMELLASVVLDKKSGEAAAEYGAKEGHRGCVGREKAVERVKEGCVEHWGMRRGGEEEEEEIKKGSPPVVKVQIKNVGKRQVTLVSGHEPWGLFTSEELAEELKKKSASSTSIQPLAGSSKKGQPPRVEVMCQGSHDALVVKLLTGRWGVPRAFVEVDLSKSKK